MDRRQFLIRLGAAGVTGAVTLTGCGNDSGGGDNPEEEPTEVCLS